MMNIRWMNNSVDAPRCKIARLIQPLIRLFVNGALAPRRVTPFAERKILIISVGNRLVYCHTDPANRQFEIDPCVCGVCVTHAHTHIHTQTSKRATAKDSFLIW